MISGLNSPFQSMSDVAAKKKYPFELEKAMHNVMFIQHHMERQDEFNAVSFCNNYVLPANFRKKIRYILMIRNVTSIHSHFNL